MKTKLIDLISVPQACSLFVLMDELNYMELLKEKEEIMFFNEAWAKA